VNNFAEYLTPEQAHKQYLDINEGKSPFSLRQLRHMASDGRKCQCGEPVWRMVGQDLCFSCTTGEADASDDYELIYTPLKRSSRSSKTQH